MGENPMQEKPVWRNPLLVNPAAAARIWCTRCLSNAPAYPASGGGGDNRCPPTPAPLRG